MKKTTMDAIRRYADDHVSAGGFVMAVLCNDLSSAVGRADADNLNDLPEIVRYCHWELPGNCWGSAEKVREWLNKRTGSSSSG